MEKLIEVKIIKELIEKHFVCGYEQGIKGAMHSPYCRKCALLNELEVIINNKEE